MALTYDDLKPGDILLCFGWNAVAVGQFLAKGLGRITMLPLIRNAALTVGSFGQAPSDPVSALASASNCNHAIIIGAGLADVPTGNNQEMMRTFDIPDDEQVSIKAQGSSLIATFTRESGEPPHSPIDLSEAYKSQGFTLSEQQITRANGVRQIRALYTKPSFSQVPKVCHSTGEGTYWLPANTYFNRRQGGLELYRFAPPSGVDADLALNAGRVATTWANEWSGGEDPQYSMPKALLAGFGRSAYGNKAQQRVATYRTHRNTPGGPPTDQIYIKAGPLRNKSRDGKKEWFCSMFVIACFQAATTTEDQVRDYLPLDARYTSPMSLHGFLRRSTRWRLIGTRS